MTLEIAAGELTCSLYLRKQLFKKDLLDTHIAKGNAERNKQLLASKNIAIQVVLKQGLVEVPQTGNISDFEDAVLVNRSQVETLNDVIIRSGSRKIKQMTEDMIFRQSILQTEWQHQHRCMEIEDLKTQLRFIARIRVNCLL